MSEEKIVALAIHVTFGGVALLAGPLALYFDKGSAWHKQLGKAFYFSMLLVSCSSVYMASQTANHFLLSVGLFSLYLVVSGRRAIQWRRLLKRSRRVRQVDWILAFFIFGVGLYMASVGARLMIVENDLLGIALVAFSLIAFIQGVGDIRTFTSDGQQKGFWLMHHATKMIAGMIAAYTAFLVVNQVLPGNWAIVSWLAPTLSGSLLIGYWRRRIKSDARKRQSELVPMRGQLA